MQIPDLYEIYLHHPEVQTDTRKIKPADIFFALKGENFNGNHFALAALEKGASYAVVDEYNGPADERIIRVNDVLTALQELAGYHRNQFNIPFIAITGSNGKTTTKELIHEVLSSTYTTYTTQGNLNNHIGIPLTLLSVKRDAEIAIIEMGANHQQEIAGYCKYTRPTHGLITNCGKAHLEGFGGVEGIRKGKGELFDYLRENGGTAFVMWDYDYLREMSKGIPQIFRYGTTGADITGTVHESSQFLSVDISSGANTGTIHTQLVGAYNLPNVLAAVSAGKFFNVPDERIKLAIENYTPSNSRSQLIKKDGISIILDAYNANPSSMKAAIENFSKMDMPDKILLLGGMMELGEDSIAEHQSLVNLVNQYPWKAVVLVGGDFAKTAHAYLYFNNSAEASEWFKKEVKAPSGVLIKGSRSMQMEKVLAD